MLSPWSREDEIARRLADRRQALGPHNLYRAKDNDYLILLGFLATLVAVYLIFFHYDFAATRLVRPSANRGTTKRLKGNGGYVVTFSARRAVEPAAPGAVESSRHPDNREERSSNTLPEPRSKRNKGGVLAATSPTSGRQSTPSPKAMPCDSVGCDILEGQLASWLDAKVDPCNDFYAHVCGHWLANHTNTAGEAFVSPSTERQRLLELRLIAQLKRGTDDGSLRWPLRLWEACRKPEAEPKSGQVFQRILEEHGLLGFPFGMGTILASTTDDGKDLTSAAAKVLLLSGIPAIVGVQVVKWTTGVNSSAGRRKPWLVRLGPPDPLFRDFVRMTDTNDEWFLRAVQKIAGHRELPGLFRIEQALVELAGERRGIDDYVATTVSHLAAAAHWNWTRFLRIVFRGVSTVGLLTPVLVKGGSFERKLASLISQFGPVQLRNYLAFRLYVRYAPFLERSNQFDELSQLSGARQPGWQDGDTADNIMDLRCLRLLAHAVPELMAFIYWNGARPRNPSRKDQAAWHRRHVRRMTRDLVNSIMGTLENQMAKDKRAPPELASRFRIATGMLRRQSFLPEWLHKARLRMQFAELAFIDAEESPLASWKALLGALQRNALLKLADRGFETFWQGAALRDTPWLDKDEGYVAVPPAAIEARFDGAAFFVHHTPTLGMDLARLVAALFSQLASHHDKAWRLRLDELHDCIRRVLHGARPSSDSASREDVLDLLSLRGVLHVFRRLAANNSQRIRFNGGGEFKTDQLFFYQFALNRCEAYEEEYLRQRTYHGVRSPAPLLVNGPLKNFRPFAKAFNCPRGSAMRPGRVCKF